MCLAAVLFGVPAMAAETSASLTNAAPIAVWDSLVRASVGGGYRDNVPRTSVAPESSPFVYSSAELSLIRLSETGSQLSLFLLGEDWRYSDAPSVDSEQLASAMAQASWLLGDEAEAGGELQYIYQNQVVDVSENDADLRRLLVEGHGFWARPRWKWNFNPLWYVQTEGILLRQLFANEELDDYWEPAVKASIARKYGNRSEASLALQTAWRVFDSREQYDTSGNAIPSSSLTYWRPEVNAQLRHYWDAKRRWRTTTKLSYLWNKDNGTGYLDYDRLMFSQQARWANDLWEIRANARIGWYDYKIQKIEGDTLERSYYILDLRVERRIGKHLFLYGAVEREWDLSNDPLDEYNDWGAGGGIGLEF